MHVGESGKLFKTFLTFKTWDGKNGRTITPVFVRLWECDGAGVLPRARKMCDRRETWLCETSGMGDQKN